MELYSVHYYKLRFFSTCIVLVLLLIKYYQCSLQAFTIIVGWFLGRRQGTVCVLQRPRLLRGFIVSRLLKMGRMVVQLSGVAGYGKVSSDQLSVKSTYVNYLDGMKKVFFVFNAFVSTLHRLLFLIFMINSIEIC